MEYDSAEVRQHPNFECNCTLDDYSILMLAKAGWWGCNPSTVLATPIDLVMKAYHFENFYNKFQSAEMEMNLKK